MASHVDGGREGEQSPPDAGLRAAAVMAVATAWAGSGKWARRPAVSGSCSYAPSRRAWAPAEPRSAARHALHKKRIKRRKRCKSLGRGTQCDPAAQS